VRARASGKLEHRVKKCEKEKEKKKKKKIMKKKGERSVFKNNEQKEKQYVGCRLHVYGTIKQ
jgi:hypothetical protein